MFLRSQVEIGVDRKQLSRTGHVRSLLYGLRTAVFILRFLFLFRSSVACITFDAILTAAGIHGTNPRHNSTMTSCRLPTCDLPTNVDGAMAGVSIAYYQRCATDNVSLRSVELFTAVRAGDMGSTVVPDKFHLVPIY